MPPESEDFLNPEEAALLEDLPEEDQEDIRYLYYLWKSGSEKLQNTRRDVSYPVPSLLEFVAAYYKMLQFVHETPEESHLCEHDFNTDKIVALTAWMLAGGPSGYNSAALFYSYLFSICDATPGAGLLMFHMPAPLAICENLHVFIKRGQYIAPFTFFKGVHLAIKHIQG